MTRYSLLVNGNEMSRTDDVETARKGLHTLKVEAGDDGRLLGEIAPRERHPGHIDGAEIAAKYESPWNGGRELWEVVEWNDEKRRTVKGPARKGGTAEREVTAQDADRWIAHAVDDERLDAIMNDIRLRHPDSDELGHEDEDAIVAEEYADEIARWKEGLEEVSA